MVLSILFAAGSMITALGTTKKAASIVGATMIVGDRIELQQSRRALSLGIQKGAELSVYKLERQDLPPGFEEYAGEYVMSETEWNSFLIHIEHAQEEPELFEKGLKEFLGHAERRREDPVLSWLIKS